VPQRIRKFGLEAHSRWLARHAIPVIAQPSQVSIERGFRQPTWQKLLKSVRCLNTMLNEQFENPGIR
jgi:hypothetical protein